jgi:hypothetical protein
MTEIWNLDFGIWIEDGRANGFYSKIQNLKSKIDGENSDN